MRQINFVEIRLMNSKVFSLALKRMLLNYATDMPVHRILNSSNVVIGNTSIIEVSNYQYIVRRVMITAMGLFSMRPTFCAVLFPNDVPASF